LIAGDTTVEPSTEFHGQLHFGDLLPCLVSHLLQILVSVFKVADPLSQPVGLELTYVNFGLELLKRLILHLGLLDHAVDLALCLDEGSIEDVDLALEVSELLLQAFDDIVLLSDLKLQVLDLLLLGGGLDLGVSGFDVPVETRENLSGCLDLG
jgi:hypothetical protein